MIAAGWSMGSQTACQALVEPVIRSVRIPDERMGYVHSRGDRWRVPSWPLTVGCERVRSRDNAPVIRRVEKRPFPPPPYRSVVGGHPQFFLHFSQKGLTLCMQTLT
jgi:hypothetical protein